MAKNTFEFSDSCYVCNHKIRCRQTKVESLALETLAESIKNYDNQNRLISILVSGESGSGKTFLAKHLMHHLLNECARKIFGTTKFSSFFYHSAVVASVSTTSKSIFFDLQNGTTICQFTLTRQ